MSDPFEESPWGDQVSLSNNNSSGASSLHDHTVAPSDTTNTDTTIDTSTSVNPPPTEGNESISDIVGSTSSGTTSAMAAAGLLDANDELSSSTAHASTPGDGNQTPERIASGKSRVTPRRLAARSRKTITQPVFEEDTSTGPLGPLGPLGDSSDTGDRSNAGSNLDDSNDNDGASLVTNKLASTTLSPTKEKYTSSVLHGSNSVLQSSAGISTTISAVPGSASLFQDVPLNYPSSETDASSITGVSGPTNSNSSEFQISVGDPIKVGDITSAHTVYTVHCKTSSPNFSKSEMAVTRRYRDFRWVFHALEHNNPGIIIPPPPDKQTVGRFNEEFVEQRRSALENMLKKISAHPVLRNDPDFKLFLESEAFSNDIKNRVMSSDEVDAATSISGSSGSGLMGTLGGAFSFSAKFIETSQWFIDKKNYLDSLESQLKSLSKALDLVVNQRRELSDVTGEFALVLEALADVEISKSLSELLISFSASQTRIQDLYSRQCLQDILSLSTTIDEYLRLISSVRSVFLQRQKAYFAMQSAEHELTKKQTHLEKLLRQGKTLQDKIAALQQDVEAQEKKVLNQRVAFDDISKRIVVEFDRLEHERIHDFRNSVELFLENAVESQKEAIEVWETFYQRSFVGNASVTAS